VFNLSEPIFHAAASSFAEFASGRRLYLSCGDSAATDLPDKSVDAVITDPPFFDNVHYSQLADFFFVWQRHILNGNDVQSVVSTRSESEVQHSQADVFTDRLAGVFRECHRVLRDDGLLVFTYHHSRTDGWRCILRALVASGFGVVRVHPVKAEMSVAAPKHLAREPIDLDMIFVCRKRETLEGTDGEAEQLFREAADEARDQLARLRSRDRRVSRNDVRVVLMGQVVARLSRSNGELVLDTLEERVDDAADTLTSKAANSDG
jgi:adenine-specific DNA methylase